MRARGSQRRQMGSIPQTTTRASSRPSNVCCCHNCPVGLVEEADLPTKREVAAQVSTEQPKGHEQKQEDRSRYQRPSRHTVFPEHEGRKGHAHSRKQQTKTEDEHSKTGPPGPVFLDSERATLLRPPWAVPHLDTRCGSALITTKLHFHTVRPFDHSSSLAYHP